MKPQTGKVKLIDKGKYLLSHLRNESYVSKYLDNNDCFNIHSLDGKVGGEDQGGYVIGDSSSCIIKWAEWDYFEPFGKPASSLPPIHDVPYTEFKGIATGIPDGSTLVCNSDLEELKRKADMYDRLEPKRFNLVGELNDPSLWAFDLQSYQEPPIVEGDRVIMSKEYYTTLSSKGRIYDKITDSLNLLKS